MMANRKDSKVPNLYAPEPDASSHMNHELDNENDEPDEAEGGETEGNEEDRLNYISNALSDATITIPRGGSVSGAIGSYRQMNN